MSYLFLPCPFWQHSNSVSPFLAGKPVSSLLLPLFMLSQFRPTANFLPGQYAHFPIGSLSHVFCSSRVPLSSGTAFSQSCVPTYSLFWSLFEVDVLPICFVCGLWSLLWEPRLPYPTPQPFLSTFRVAIDLCVASSLLVCNLVFVCRGRASTSTFPSSPELPSTPRVPVRVAG